MTPRREPPRGGIPRAARNTNRLPASYPPRNLVLSLPYGDWCDSCADRNESSPVRYPIAINGDGLARYRCIVCGHRWTCWWALDSREAA